MNVTLIINGRDFSPRLSRYQCDTEIQYDEIVTTMDKTEHYFGETARNVIKFAMWPSPEDDNADYLALMHRPLIVEYTNPAYGITLKKPFRIDGDLQSKFLLASPDGSRYYNGGTITLRCLEVL